jgi:hypothetical protein
MIRNVYKILARTPERGTTVLKMILNKQNMRVHTSLILVGIKTRAMFSESHFIKAWRLPRMRMEDLLQIQRVATKLLNNQSVTADKG